MYVLYSIQLKEKVQVASDKLLKSFQCDINIQLIFKPFAQ